MTVGRKALQGSYTLPSATPSLIIGSEETEGFRFVDGHRGRARDRRRAASGRGDSSRMRLGHASLGPGKG